MPIHWAAEMGDAAVIALLAMMGSHLEVSNLQGFTPMFSAVASGQLAAVIQLVKLGVSVKGAAEFASSRNEKRILTYFRKNP